MLKPFGPALSLWSSKTLPIYSLHRRDCLGMGILYNQKCKEMYFVLLVFLEETQQLGCSRSSIISLIRMAY